MTITKTLILHDNVSERDSKLFVQKEVDKYYEKVRFKLVIHKWSPTSLTNLKNFIDIHNCEYEEDLASK